ncbi:molecular chaperone [filamentous cyanobacterium CCP5]|nr:molecular chaperone [filamentous cyanobacterium CCP5]
MASLTRWHPFREVESLQREMNRLFDSFSPAQLSEGNGFMPAAEISETDSAVDLRIEVPGLQPEDIDIQVSADSVTISGERKSETKTEEDGVTRSEFHYGSFQRVVPLPSRIENNNVQAEYKDGILKLHMLKLEEERHRVVKVNLS